MDLLALSFKLMILVPILTTNARSHRECYIFGNSHTCMENANCEALKDAEDFGYCACHSQFYQTANGTCVRKQYGKSCNLNEDCGSDTNLICDEKKICSCNSNHSIYYDNNHECVGNLGASCDEYGKPCSVNATCSNGVCKCSSEFFENSSGECEAKRGHGSSCKDNGDSCKPPFICDSNFQCSCNSSTFLYDNAKDKCSRLVGAACGQDPWNHIIQDCVTNAECTPTTGYYIKSHCNCKSGYRMTLRKTCVVEHDNSCTNEDTQSCDEEREGTLCIEGRCSCRAGHVFDENRRQCVARLHSQCNETLFCAEDTHCEPVPKDHFKLCVCNQGLVEVDNNCHPTLGQPCDFNDVYTRKPSRICDPLAGSLQCVNGICQCKTMEYYDRGSQKCRGLFGSYCDLENLDDNGKDKYCTQNAQCVVHRVLLNKQGMCTCKLDWKRTADGFCN
ncbi:unnamed protein product [Orchesella dallaii]|uniref:EGF-like domain-containing protein n=1 Tax=Orchesella dallaii TaxID=48710 RepID=A0ABP1PW23_9HEXA